MGMTNRAKFAAVLATAAVAATMASVLPAGASTSDTVINFDSLGYGVNVTTQFPGVTFAGAEALVVPYYNYGMYPPHSGSTVVDAVGGAITVTLTGTTSKLGAWVTTGGVTMTETCRDSSGNVVGTATQSSNYWSNNLVSVSAAGIHACTFSGRADFLTLDDLTYSTFSLADLLAQQDALLARANVPAQVIAQLDMMAKMATSGTATSPVIAKGYAAELSVLTPHYLSAAQASALISELSSLMTS